MIHSKYKTFGFWLGAGAMMLYIVLTISCITQFYFDFTIIKIHIPNQRSFNAWMIVNGIACLLFGVMLSYRASSITINFEDSFKKDISFKNLLTRHTKTYSFKELDGYITTKLWHRQFNENKTLCLIKEGRIIKKIDNFFYSNVAELQEGLKDLKYLGYKSMGIVNSWKVFFNQPIIRP